MSVSPAESLEGRTILITGATRGIGYATAAELAQMGAQVIVHGRDEGRLQRAVTGIRRRAPAAKIEGILADLASLEAVRRLAGEVMRRHERLDVLINNAGLVTRRRQESEDGFERQFAVNHLAPFLLTNLLLDRLTASAPARIVTVSSMAHKRADFDLEDLNWKRRPYNGLGAYGATKLANILFTRELARRLEGTGVTANCLHPGVVATHIFAGMGVLGSLFGIVGRVFLISANEGASTSVYLASSPAVQDVNGQFFSNAQPVEPAAAARDDTAAAALWRLSEQMTGLAA